MTFKRVKLSSNQPKKCLKCIKLAFCAEILAFTRVVTHLEFLHSHSMSVVLEIAYASLKGLYKLDIFVQHRSLELQQRTVALKGYLTSPWTSRFHVPVSYVLSYRVSQ